MGKGENFDSERIFDKELIESLNSFGFLFPTTIEEVSEFEKEFDINSVEIPTSLQDPMKILKKGKIKSISRKESLIVSMNSKASMRMAARKGSKIPKEILDKMKKDRLDSENENKE